MPLQVNVKRGMLRLWIVLSIAWAALAVPLTWKDLTQTRCARWEGGVRTWTARPWECDPVVASVHSTAVPAAPAATSDTSPHPEPFRGFDFGGAERAGATPTQIIEFLAPRVNFRLEDARKAGGTDAQIYDFMRSRFDVAGRSAPPSTTVVFREILYWPAVTNALVFIITPPFVSVIAGIASLWIFAGFRTKDQ
jgi:hypothetical protein